jgi:hypothetical protein
MDSDYGIRVIHESGIIVSVIRMILVAFKEFGDLLTFFATTKGLAVCVIS